MMSYRTKRAPNTVYTRAAKRRKYSRRNQGLVPTYSGYNPRQFVRGEWKYADTTINQLIDQTGAITLLNGLSPGTGANQRIGMKVAIRSIEMRLVCYVIAGTGVDQMQRLNLFFDRQANGVAPAVGEQLSSNSVTYPRNLTQRKRFKIIWDKFYTLNATGESGSMKAFKLYMKFRRPINVEYNAGTTGTVADIVTNSLLFYGVGNVAAGPTAGAVAGRARIRYTDL